MALSTNPNAIPDSYHRFTPCLTVQGGDDALELQRSPQDQFYGDRDAFLIDPFGHGWTVATHIEDVAPDELARRLAALQG